jgi:hypothetical protein
MIDDDDYRQSEPLPTRRLGPSLDNAILLLLGSAAFVVFGLLAMPDGTWGKYLVVGFFSLCTLTGLLLCVETVTGRSSLVLDPVGWQVRYMFGVKEHRWTDCGPFYVFEILHRGIVISRLVVCDPIEAENDSPDSLENKIGRMLKKTGPGMNFGMKAQDLADLMNRYREAALERVG